jgi:hypothetical protein
MLELFRNAISDEEMYLLTRVLLERASAGDMSAMKMIWQYKLGKPLQAPNPDAIDRDEWNHFQKDAMTLDEMKKVLNQLPSRIGNAIVSAALPNIAETVSQNLAAQLFQSLPADYFAQPATEPVADTPTQTRPTPFIPAAVPVRKEEAPVSNGFSAETRPVANGSAPEERPISNGFLAETSPISNDSSLEITPLTNRHCPVLDAHGLPSQTLPPFLPARWSAASPVPPAQPSSTVSNGKSRKKRPPCKEACPVPSVGMEQLRLQCAW